MTVKVRDGLPLQEASVAIINQDQLLARIIVVSIVVFRDPFVGR